MTKNIFTAAFCRVSIPNKEYLFGKFADGFLIQIIATHLGSNVQVWKESKSGDFIVGVSQEREAHLQALINQHFEFLTAGLQNYTMYYIEEKQLYPPDNAVPKNLDIALLKQV